MKQRSNSPSAKIAGRGWYWRRQRFPPGPSGSGEDSRGSLHPLESSRESALGARHQLELRSLEHPWLRPATPHPLLSFRDFLGPTQCPKGKKAIHKLISTAFRSSLDLPDSQKGKWAL